MVCMNIDDYGPEAGEMLDSRVGAFIYARTRGDTGWMGCANCAGSAGLGEEVGDMETSDTYWSRYGTGTRDVSGGERWTDGLGKHLARDRTRNPEG